MAEKKERYKCIDCGREVEINLAKAKKIICPACGYRILKKPRPRAVKQVSAD